MCTVAAVGDNTIDRFVGERQDVLVGGNALNVAVQFRALGESVSYFGAVGLDADGDRIRRVLADKGIDTEGLQSTDGTTATTRVRVLPSGERIFEEEQYGLSGTYTPTAADLVALATYSCVHIGMLTEPESVRRALFGRGPLLSQDCAVSTGFDHLDVAFCSPGQERDGAEQLLIRAVQAGAELAVGTLGADGSIAYDGRSWFHVPARAMNLVDTTGAGDSYIAAFLQARLDGADMSAAMEAGTALAAKTCGHLGGFPQEG